MKICFKQIKIFLFLFIFFFAAVAIKFCQKKENKFTAPSKQFFAYGKNFRGKVNLACGKIDKENRLVVAPQNSNFSQVKIFDENRKLVKEFNVSKDKESFNVAIGDVVGDNKNELVFGQEKNRSNVYIYEQKGKKFILLKSFEAFKDVPIGVNIALGDVAGDDKKEIIIGAGKGGGPQIKVFNALGRELGSFFAFHPGIKEGVKVGALDFDSDNLAQLGQNHAERGKKDEIVALTDFEKELQFKVYKFDRIFSLQNTARVYGNKIKVPVNLTITDINSDGKKEIAIIPQKKLGQEIKIFDRLSEISNSFLDDFIDKQGGVNLAICDLSDDKKEDIIVNKNNSLVEVFYR